MRTATFSRRFALTGALALGLSLGLSTPALALTLEEARLGGHVIEGADGFLEVRTDTAEVRTLVQQVNQRRRSVYAELAQREGRTIDVVAVIAAEEIVNRLPAGAYYRTSGGQLRQR